MKPRPTIFLSGVSQEFGTFRDAIEKEVEMKDCFAENQPGFPPDYRTVEEMLKRKIGESDAVIHIVGFRFGAEPSHRPADMPRRSYTQMEFDIALRLGKPVYRFLSTSDKIRDKPRTKLPAEDGEARQLQLAHRNAVQQANHLFYFFNDKEELCKLAAEIPPVVTAGFRADISRIDRYAPEQLIGREDELKLLTDMWGKVRRTESPKPNVLTFMALGGEGKTSLVAKWVAMLAAENWLGCDAAFAWSFYSQGAHEQTAAASDLFLAAALTFFGDPATANSARPAWDKGKTLADLIGARRVLLILDGLEPLQYPPTAPREITGRLKDQGITALLKGLAVRNAGLCVVTTRYSVTDLKNYRQAGAPEIKLLRLSRAAGVELLKSLGVHGTYPEYENLVEYVKGHALTLNLLGNFLHDAYAGDIRKRDLVRLEEADDEEQGGHAFRVLDAYVAWFESEGDKGQRAVSVLRLLGLFDRPASADCIAALKQAPAIIGLTEVLVGMTEAQRNLELTRLEEARLLTVNRGEAGALLSLDAHPLLREYFGRQLRTRQPEAYRAAHRRLYEHLCATTKAKPQPTLEELQPLYQAVTHGCLADMHQSAFDAVYFPRILHESSFYSTDVLGAVFSDLGILSCFLEVLWSVPVSTLSRFAQGWVLNEVGFNLLALLRPKEAVNPMEKALDMAIEELNYFEASRRAGNLFLIRLTNGDVAGALDAALEVREFAKNAGSASFLAAGQIAYGVALTISGKYRQGLQEIDESVFLNPEPNLDFTLLYGTTLLLPAERFAWLQTLGVNTDAPFQYDPAACAGVVKRCEQTIRTAEAGLDIGRQHGLLLRSAMERLTISRAKFFKSFHIPSRADKENAIRESSSIVAEAVTGLRQANRSHFLPEGLLTRAWLRFFEDRRIGPESAQTDLDDAWEIAERGPMPLFQADIYLYRARLFHTVAPYPWASDVEGRFRGPKDDLAAARKLIEKCGYWRRKEELEDAEAAAQQWRD